MSKSKRLPAVPARRMPIDTIRVIWDNTNSPLLPHDNGGVFLWWNGQPAGPAFDVNAHSHIPVSLPPEVTEFEVRVGFRPPNKVLSDPPVPEVAAYVDPHDARFSLNDSLRFVQRYRLTQSRLYLEAIGSSRFGGQPNPLVSSPAYSGSTATIKVNTDFVDLTPWWPKYAQAWDGFEAELRQQGNGAQVYVLGCTAATAAAGLVCVVVVPPSCRNSDAVSILTFFRPAANSPWSRFDEYHESGHFMRYFLSPYDDTTDVPVHTRDHVWDTPRVGGDLVRCGFAQALQRSGRSVVLVYPLPLAARFGPFETDFTRMSESIVRCLWGNEAERLNSQLVREPSQAVGDQQNIVRGVRAARRIGAAGFSLGGSGLTRAWQRSHNAIDELYLFDPTDRPTISELEAWLLRFESGKSPTLRGRSLRIVWGQQDANRVVGQGLERHLRATGLDPSSRVTVWPPDDSFYLQLGKTPYFDHTIHRFPAMRDRGSYGDVFHQYAVFGSDDTEQVGIQRRTFLEQFLSESGF